MRPGPYGSSTVLAKSSARCPATISSGRTAPGGRAGCVCIKTQFTGCTPGGVHDCVSGMSALTGNRASLRLGIAVACLAQFVVVLDATIVTTALPVVGEALGFTGGSLHWVITAYTLAFGGF